MLSTYLIEVSQSDFRFKETIKILSYYPFLSVFIWAVMNATMILGVRAVSRFCIYECCKCDESYLPVFAFISCKISGLRVTMPDPLGRKSLGKKNEKKSYHTTHLTYYIQNEFQIVKYDFLSSRHFLFNWRVTELKIKVLRTNNGIDKNIINRFATDISRIFHQNKAAIVAATLQKF